MAINPYVVLVATACAAIVVIAALPEWRSLRRVLSPQGLRRGQRNAFSDVLPYERFLAADVIELDNRCLLAAWDISARETGTLDDEQIINTTYLLSAAYGAIPVGAALQIYTTRSEAGEYQPGMGLDHPVGKVFDEMRARQFTHDERVMATTVTIALTWRPPSETKEQMRARLAAGAAAKPRSKAGIIAEFQNLCETFEAALTRDYVKVARLGEHTEFGEQYSDLLAFVGGCVTGVRQKMRTPPLLLRLKHLLAVEAVGGSHPIIGDRYATAIEFHELPDGAVPQMLDGISTRTRVPFVFHVRYVAQNVSKVKKRLRTARRDFEGASKFRTGGGVDPDQVQAAEQMMDAFGKATKDESRFGEVSLSIVVRARARDLLRKAENEVLAVMEDAGFRCSVKRLGALDLILSTFPGNLSYGVRRFPLDSLTIAKMVPLHTPDIGRPYAESEALPFTTPPTTFGLTPGNNQLRIHGNSGGLWHAIMSGPSDSGKSVGSTLWSLSMRTRLPLVGVTTVDSGPSQYQICKLLDGQYYRPGTSDGLGFALFRHVHEPEEALAVLAIIEEEIVKPALGEVSTTHHTVLQAAMVRMAEMDWHKRSMLAFYDLIADRDAELRPVIRRFTRYELGTIIDCEEDSFDVGRYNVVDIRDIVGLPLQTLGPIYRTILHKCRSQVERLKARMGAAGRSLHWWYSFDEAHRLFSNDMFSQAILETLKEGRKFNYSVNLISNSVFDFNKFKFRDDLLAQTRTRIYYGDTDAIATNPRTLQAYADMGVPDRGIAMLPRLPERSFLLQQPGILREVRFAITKEQLAVLGTSRTAPLVDEAIARWGSGWKVPFLRQQGATWAADRLESLERSDDYREDRVRELLLGGVA